MEKGLHNRAFCPPYWTEFLTTQRCLLAHKLPLSYLVTQLLSQLLPQLLSQVLSNTVPQAAEIFFKNQK